MSNSKPGGVLKLRRIRMKEIKDMLAGRYVRTVFYIGGSFSAVKAQVEVSRNGIKLDPGVGKPYNPVAFIDNETIVDIEDFYRTMPVIHVHPESSKRR